MKLWKSFYRWCSERIGPGPSRKELIFSLKVGKASVMPVFLQICIIRCTVTGRVTVNLVRACLFIIV